MSHARLVPLLVQPQPETGTGMRRLDASASLTRLLRSVETAALAGMAPGGGTAPWQAEGSSQPAAGHAAAEGSQGQLREPELQPLVMQQRERQGQQAQQGRGHAQDAYARWAPHHDAAASGQSATSEFTSPDVAPEVGGPCSQAGLQGGAWCGLPQPYYSGSYPHACAHRRSLCLCRHMHVAARTLAGIGCGGRARRAWVATPPRNACLCALLPGAAAAAAAREIVCLMVSPPSGVTCRQHGAAALRAGPAVGGGGAPHACIRQCRKRSWGWGCGCIRPHGCSGGGA